MAPAAQRGRSERPPGPARTRSPGSARWGLRPPSPAVLRSDAPPPLQTPVGTWARASCRLQAGVPGAVAGPFCLPQRREGSSAPAWSAASALDERGAGGSPPPRRCSQCAQPETPQPTRGCALNAQQPWRSSGLCPALPAPQAPLRPTLASSPGLVPRGSFSAGLFPDVPLFKGRCFVWKALVECCPDARPGVSPAGPSPRPQTPSRRAGRTPAARASPCLCSSTPPPRHPARALALPGQALLRCGCHLPAGGAAHPYSAAPSWPRGLLSLRPLKPSSPQSLPTRCCR